MKLKKIWLLSIIPCMVFAFKPGGAWYTGSGNPNNHKTITEGGISKIIVDGKELSFSAEALSAITTANGLVDYNEFSNPAAHCDGEHIHGKDGCNGRLVRLKEEIIQELLQKSPTFDAARKKLGQSMHTIQDFYSHSNWVNRGNSNPYADLTKKLLPRQSGERIVDSSDYKTCEWTWGLFTGSLLPDYRPTPTLTLEKRGKEIITTGYFEGYLGEADPEHYKCDHGIKGGNGLNKDTASQHLHGTAATVAKEHSARFVTDIVDAILASKSLSATEKAKNIAKFLGDKESSANLGFIVDTTGSMGSTITGIKSAMTSTVNKLKEEDRDIENFYLISYGDPSIGSVLHATDVDTMLSNINTVTLGIPDYGGDFPELALDGLLKVVTTASDNTELYLYTDATTKNAHLKDSIIKTANAKNIKINFFLSGSSDASYTGIATATGGKLIPYAHTVSGAEGTFSHINPSFDGNLEELLKIVGKIPGSSSKLTTSLKATKLTCTDSQECGNFVYAIDNIESSESKSYQKLTKVTGENTVEHDINVDNSSEKVLINVQMNPIGTITLIRPDGTEVVDGDSDITIVKTSVSQSMTISIPTVGTWKVSITGNAGQDYSVDVDMVTEIRIIDFNFAEVKGRAGHEGLFPVDGQPLNTSEQYVTLVVAGDIKTLAMQVLALDGTKLSDITLTETSKNDISVEYFGKLALPSQSFRIVIVGEDTAGAKFERVYNQVYVGQSISVKPVTKKPVLLQANKESELVFTVTNTGVSDTFILSATKEDGSVITLDETEITLDNNKSKEIRVQFITPSDIAEKDTYSVTLSAQSKSNSESKNYAIYKAEVNDEDLDNDGVSDKMEQFIYDGNKDGKDDYNQSNVISILSESGIGFTFEVKDANFTNMLVKEVPENVKTVTEGEMPFGLFDFKVSKATEMKITYSGNIYPTGYYKYDNASNSYEKDTTAKFEKGYATIKVDSLTQKGFLVFNNKRPSAYVEKQKIFKNESVTLDLLEQSYDEDGDTIRILSIDSKSHQNGTVVKVADSISKVTYTAPTDFKGTDYFQYKITDDKGGYYSVDVEIEISEKSTEPTEEPKKSGGGALGFLLPLLMFGLLLFRRKD